MATKLITDGVEFPDNTQQPTALPVSAIIRWSGAIANIPSGWQLCDGTNGTPDLRDRFIIGAGSTYSSGNTGGANTIALTAPQIPIHTHTASATLNADPNHSHTSPGTGTNPNHGHPTNVVAHSSGPIAEGNPGGGRYGTVTTTGAGGSHAHVITVEAVPNHTHPVTVSITGGGSGTEHENKPPFYALAYIKGVV